MFNTLFQLAQLFAIIGPSAAIISWLFNLIEWCCCKLKTTFFVTFTFLCIGFIGQGLSVYMIIVNIGATQQGNYAIEKFPSVHGILYENQNEGEPVKQIVHVSNVRPEA